ncbi:SMR family transporter [Sandarakinorhabdus sp.]|uniref:DMT family transporter n=1 Tax=Sandarakinorhabdus sp. TaxID=1916663 RepID=UPI00286E4D67|nr:SMR family transporter [Sandarakinorhabdus sp.]
MAFWAANWAWGALFLGGLFEAGFTTALRHIDGGRNIGALIAFLVSVTASMGLLALAGRHIPMGTAYAVWAGIGAAATAIIGVACYAEPMSLVRGLLVIGLIGCIVGLKALG